MKRIAGIVLVVVLAALLYAEYFGATCYIPLPKPVPRILWTYEAPQRGASLRRRGSREIPFLRRRC